MTPRQVETFVRRLVAGKVSGAEMAGLLVVDLLNVSDYLLQHPELLETPSVSSSRFRNKATQGFYSEQEILDELDITA